MTDQKPLLPEDILEAMLDAGLTEQVEALRDILTDSEENKTIADRVRDVARLHWAVGDGVFDGLAYGPPVELPYSTEVVKNTVVDSVTEYLLYGTLATVPVPVDPLVTPGVFPIYDERCTRCVETGHVVCQQEGHHDIPGQREPVLEWQDPEGLVRYYTNGTVSFHDNMAGRDSDHLTAKERAVLEERYATWPVDADVSLQLRKHWDLLAAAEQAEKHEVTVTRYTGRLPAPGVQLTGEEFPPARRRPTDQEELTLLADTFGDTTWVDEGKKVRYWKSGSVSFHDDGGILNDDGLTSTEAELMARHYEETAARRGLSPTVKEALDAWLETQQEDEEGAVLVEQYVEVMGSRETTPEQLAARQAWRDSRAHGDA